MNIDFNAIEKGNTAAFQEAILHLVDLYNTPDFNDGYKAGMKDAAMALRGLLNEQFETTGFCKVVRVEDIEELIKTLEHE